MRRKNLLKLLCPCVVFLLCLSVESSHAQTVVDALNAAGRTIDWSKAGIPGGIPNRTTICTTLNPGATAAQINSAIVSCPAGQVVFLTAGTYNLTTGITFRGAKAVTLRGAGANKTMLVFTGDNACSGLFSSVCMEGTSPNWYNDPGTVYSWTAGYAKGTTVITLNTTAGLDVGTLLVLDQLNDSPASLESTSGILVCDTVGICSLEGGGARRAGPRQQQQYVEITAINGNNVTISPGLHMPNWSGSKTPQAWHVGTSSQVGGGRGLENLTVDSRNNNALRSIGITNTLQSWVKGVRSIQANRSHITFWAVKNIEVRDSYFYGSKNSANVSYGMDPFMASDILVINTIHNKNSSPFTVNPCSGCVFAYNFTIDHPYNPSPAYFLAAMSKHEGGAGMLLFEGNITNGFEQDGFHGTGNFLTNFRNLYPGTETGKTNNTCAYGIWAGDRYNAAVGNVLGTSGWSSVYEKYPGLTAGNSNQTIFHLGFSGHADGTNYGNDSHVRETMVRWGNFDHATGTSRFVTSEIASNVTVPSTPAIPASMFLSAKPAFFGSIPWPPIGPDVTGGNADPSGHAYRIPAQICYENTAKDASGILDFNPDSCYGTTLGTTPAPPTSLSTQ